VHTQDSRRPNTGTRPDPGPSGRSADLPPWWPRRDRLQQRGKPDPPDRSQSQKRPICGTRRGRKSLGRIASLIETCKINGVEPFAYLRATLAAIAAGHPQKRIDDLLPWNFTTSIW